MVRFTELTPKLVFYKVLQKEIESLVTSTKEEVILHHAVLVPSNCPFPHLETHSLVILYAVTKPVLMFGVVISWVVQIQSPLIPAHKQVTMETLLVHGMLVISIGISASLVIPLVIITQVSN